MRIYQHPYPPNLQYKVIKEMKNFHYITFSAAIRRWSLMNYLNATIIYSPLFKYYLYLAVFTRAYMPFLTGPYTIIGQKTIVGSAAFTSHQGVHGHGHGHGWRAPLGPPPNISPAQMIYCRVHKTLIESIFSSGRRLFSCLALLFLFFFIFRYFCSFRRGGIQLYL